MTPKRKRWWQWWKKAAQPRRTKVVGTDPDLLPLLAIFGIDRPEETRDVEISIKLPLRGAAMIETRVERVADKDQISRLTNFLHETDLVRRCERTEF